MSPPAAPFPTPSADCARSCNMFTCSSTSACRVAVLPLSSETSKVSDMQCGNNGQRQNFYAKQELGNTSQIRSCCRCSRTSVCIFVYLYVKVYKYKCIYIYMRYIYIYIFFYLFIYSFIYLFLYLYLYLYLHTHVCVYIYICVCVCLCTRVYIYICICIYIHTYISVIPVVEVSWSHVFSVHRAHSACQLTESPHNRHPSQNNTSNLQRPSTQALNAKTPDWMPKA